MQWLCTYTGESAFCRFGLFMVYINHLHTSSRERWVVVKDREATQMGEVNRKCNMMISRYLGRRIPTVVPLVVNGLSV